MRWSCRTFCIARGELAGVVERPAARYGHDVTAGSGARAREYRMRIEVNGTRLWFDVDGPVLVTDGRQMLATDRDFGTRRSWQL